MKITNVTKEIKLLAQELAALEYYSDEVAASLAKKEVANYEKRMRKVFSLKLKFVAMMNDGIFMMRICPQCVKADRADPQGEYFFKITSFCPLMQSSFYNEWTLYDKQVYFHDIYGIQVPGGCRLHGHSKKTENVKIWFKDFLENVLDPERHKDRFGLNNAKINL